ncbi:diacylglycerol kinase [Vibrio sp. 10N.286.49.B3]|uniref:diacylglycerol kinase n=1 Tax=Vibrio sp. 10N.286.49.B3 TaxID=1880855 RepID=UPI000C855585|nr:diacylglycerol kinase [Vibrio sp. 10N.286.49.B3]PMH45983.1 diacylglycerol kinase [Vibrio sp. 10N.286.49.B3]
MTGKPGNTGFKRVIKATGYSMQGLKAAFKYEAAVRQELGLLVVALILTIVLYFALGLSVVESILMVGSVVLVLIVELLNSAIEAIVDRVSTEHHELSGRAKDIGSSAVFIALALAGFTWLLILLQYL